MTGSFRLKLTLLAACTSGVVIAAFGLVTWGLVSWSGSDRLDREIKAAAMDFRDTGPVRTGADGNAVASFYGDELKQIKFGVRDVEGSRLFESEGWPAGLEENLPQLSPGSGPKRCRRLHGTWAWGPGTTHGTHAEPHSESQHAESHHAGGGHGEGHQGGAGSPCGGCEGGACDYAAPTPPASHSKSVSAESPAPASPAAASRPATTRPPSTGPSSTAANPAVAGCPCARAAGFSTVALDSGVWRVGAFPDGPLTLYAAVNLDHISARSKRLGFFVGASLALALLAAGLGGWWLANRALIPLTALTLAAKEITAEQLQRRIPGEGADREFAQLIGVFNQMLERLEASYLQATRFSADVSHELKTPLAIMQGEVESALQEAPEGGPEQRALASQLEAIHRLNGLVHKLLLLSRADAGTLRPRLSEVDLSARTNEFCADFAALHPELHFEQEIAPDLVLRADPSLLPQVVQNLLSNAVKYNRPGGWVRVTLQADASEVALRVTNSGPPISAEARERLFDRFYRADAARSMAGGGGLGLSLAREFARAHGGEVVLEDPQEEGAHTFCLRLPRAQPRAETRELEQAPAGTF